MPQRPQTGTLVTTENDDGDEDSTGSEKRHQPELNTSATVERKPPAENEFAYEFDTEADDDSVRANRMNQIVQGVARQVSLDPNDGIDL